MISSDQEHSPSAAPDWGTLKQDPGCPLCDYNLRGLAEPRCPECGFKFDWRELLDEQRNRHPYLFEHHAKHNIWSFWKTFWNDCRPRRFWRELSPVHSVRMKRLLIYWLVADGILLMAMVNPFIQSGRTILRQNSMISAVYKLVPGSTNYQASFGGKQYQLPAATYNQMVHPPWTWNFITAVWRQGIRRFTIIDSVVLVITWPWATLLTLLIFQASMRRAKIKTGHVLRCAIYGCDFALLAIVLLSIFWFLSDGGDRSVPYLLIMILPFVALYRLTFAYKNYLRFDHPFWTVLASQMMVFLLLLIVLLNWTRWW